MSGKREERRKMPVRYKGICLYGALGKTASNEWAGSLEIEIIVREYKFLNEGVIAIGNEALN